MATVYMKRSNIYSRSSSMGGLPYITINSTFEFRSNTLKNNLTVLLHIKKLQFPLQLC